MTLLQPAQKQMAFAKVGMLGFQGSGKTHTSIVAMLGLAKMIGAKQIAMQDTETGSDWVLEMVEAEGLELLVLKSRAFQDMLTIGQECVDRGIPILLIDSITHIWRELMDSYMAKKKITKIAFHHWGDIKGDWKNWTDFFINSPIHIFVCGRAGFEYDYDFDDQGDKDLIKTGTKMKVETEFGFEPSLVIEMERTTVDKDILVELKKKATTNKKLKQKKQAFQPGVGSQWIHRAHILKDRSRRLNGHMLDNPTFDDFLPHFEFLNLGGEHFGLDTGRDSKERFDITGRPEWKQRKITKEIALEEIQAFLVELWPSATAADKKAKADMLENMFGSRSWKHVEERVLLPELQVARDALDILRTNYAQWSEEETDPVKLWDKAVAAHDVSMEGPEPEQDVLL